MTSQETCRAFLDQWDEVAFRDPAAGHAHALEGLRRVERMGNPPKLHARALAIFGSSLRGQEPERAVKVLREALLIYRDEIDERVDECDAQRRYGIALTALPDPPWEDALFIFRDAFKYLDTVSETEMAAWVQIQIGAARGATGAHSEAFKIFTDAMPKLQDGPLSNTLQNLHTAHVLARRTGQTISPDLRRRGLEQLRLARMAPSSRERWGAVRPNQRASYGTPKLTEADAAARWTIGMLLEDERQLEPAVWQLTTARRDLLTLGYTVKAAAISLDLGQVLAKLGRWRKLKKVAKETCGLLEGSPRLYEAFDLWRLAAAECEMEELNARAKACHAAMEAQMRRP